MEIACLMLMLLISQAIVESRYNQYPLDLATTLDRGSDDCNITEIKSVSPSSHTSPPTINSDRATIYARYTCHQGFEPDTGSLERRCQGTDVWAGTPLNCKPDCGWLPPIRHVEVGYIMEGGRAVAILRCAKGSRRAGGAGRMTCDHGRWTGGLPLYCQPPPKESPPTFPKPDPIPVFRPPTYPSRPPTNTPDFEHIRRSCTRKGNVYIILDRQCRKFLQVDMSTRNRGTHICPDDLVFDTAVCVCNRKTTHCRPY